MEFSSVKHYSMIVRMLQIKILCYSSKITNIKCELFNLNLPDYLFLG